MKKFILIMLVALPSSFARAQIVVNAPAFPTVNTYISGANNVSCYGGNDGAANVAISTGTPPYNINWGPSSPTGQGSTAVSNLWAGTWIVTVTDALGCVGTNWVLITQPDSMQILYVVAGTTVSILVSGGSPSSPGVYHYEWIPEPTSGQFTNSATFDPGTTNVLVKVVDGHWCEKVMPINLSTASINETTTSTISIYPNPVENVLNINSGDSKIAVIQLFDATGKLISTFNGMTNTLDVSALATGIYILTITDENGRVSRSKVVKK